MQARNIEALKEVLAKYGWMPYVVELTFDGNKLIGQRELGHVAVKIE